MKRFDGPEGLKNLELLGQGLAAATDSLVPREKLGWLMLLFEWAPPEGEEEQLNTTWVASPRCNRKDFPAMLRELADVIEKGADLPPHNVPTA